MKLILFFEFSTGVNNHLVLTLLVEIECNFDMGTESLLWRTS